MSRIILGACVYEPTSAIKNISEFVEYLSEISAIIQSSGIEPVYVVEDYYAQQGELFGMELVDLLHVSVLVVWPGHVRQWLGYVQQLFSVVHGLRSWLDNCVTTDAAKQPIVGVRVLYGVFWSDHFPIEINCNFNVIKSKYVNTTKDLSRVKFEERDNVQIYKYMDICNTLFRDINYPLDLRICPDKMCSSMSHRHVIV